MLDLGRGEIVGSLMTTEDILELFSRCLLKASFKKSLLILSANNIHYLI